jgi:putative hemolysin
MAELAVVAARKPRLQQLADEGQHSAQTALDLAAEPGQFLSTVQIGITLVGILAGAFGSATLAQQLAEQLARVPLLAAYAGPLAVGIVVVLVTYLSLVLGELAPKQLALHNPEGVAVRVAGPMQRLSRWTAPLVQVLNVSTEAILRVLRVRATPQPAVTEEEVRIMLEQGAELGVFLPLEEELVGQVFRLADRRVDALLTPRTEIVWLDIHDPIEVTIQKVVSSGRSRLPVAEEQLDRLLGIVLAKDLLSQCLAGETIDLRAILRPALFVPETTPALTVVERFKETHSKLAIVIDEYGGVEGMVTVDDILAALVGDIPEPGDLGEAEAVQREDGSWLLDGMFAIDDFQELFEIRQLPLATEGYYQTVGGFVMASLGHVPHAGDRFEWEGLRIEVLDMDGRRVDKVLVTRMPTSDE